MANIYVGTYAKYNNGSIEGKWIDPEDYADKEDFLAACRELHSDEADPELMFQDHEECGGFVTESNVDEYLWTWLELSDTQRTVLEVYREHINSDADIDEAEEHYSGTYNTKEDHAQELAEEIGAVDPNAKWPLNCIDWEAAARELEMGGDYTYIRHEGELWVFRG